MTRELFDLTFLSGGDQFGDEITVTLDVDDPDGMELSLATHLSRAIRRAGGDMSDLADCVVEIRGHGRQAVRMTFQTDTWVEE